MHESFKVRASRILSFEGSGSWLIMAKKIHHFVQDKP
jgi:hypothetical protein